MTKQKRRLITLVSLVVGVCVFAGAAIANIATSSGYTVFKNAVIGLTKGVDNYTLQTEYKVSVDGKPIAREVSYEMYSAEGDANLYRTNKSYKGGNQEPDYESVTYMQDGKDIYIDRDGGDVYDNSDYYHPEYSSSLGNGMGIEEEENQKIVRFVELLADTLVGDLKNNFVYVSGDNDSKQYAITLDGMQIPELVNAGLSVVFSEEFNSSNPDDPMAVLGKDPIVRYGSMVFTVDNEGRLTKDEVDIELVGRDQNGKEHTLTLELALELSDYGTTVPQKIDLDTLGDDVKIRYIDKDGIAIEETKAEEIE